MLSRKTVVGIQGNCFTINGALTYTAQAGYPNASPLLRGRLMMMKSANCIFDDARYPEWGSDKTPYFGHVSWDYPDGPWDPERNTREFIAQLPNYKACGLSAIYVNLMGNQPTGVAAGHPWINCGYTPLGDLKPEYAKRLCAVLDAADELGLAVFVGLSYPIVDRNVMVQDSNEQDDLLIQRMISNTVSYLALTGHRNILIEIGNESNQNCYNHRMLMGEGIKQAIAIAKKACRGLFPVSTSVCYFHDLPVDALADGDFYLLHAPHAIPSLAANYIRQVQERLGNDKPIILKEDMSVMCMMEALSLGVGFGLYHQGVNNYCEGFQTIPINWKINTVGKWNYFSQLARLSGQPMPERPMDLPDAPCAQLEGLEAGQQVADLGSLHLHFTAPAYYSKEYPLFLQRVEYFVDGVPVKAAGCINQFNCPGKPVPHFETTPAPVSFDLTGEDLTHGVAGFDARNLPKGQHTITAIPYYIDQWELSSRQELKVGFRERPGTVLEIPFELV